MQVYSGYCQSLCILLIGVWCMIMDQWFVSDTCSILLGIPAVSLLSCCPPLQTYCWTSEPLLWARRVRSCTTPAPSVYTTSLPGSLSISLLPCPLTCCMLSTSAWWVSSLCDVVCLRVLICVFLHQHKQQMVCDRLTKGAQTNSPDSPMWEEHLNEAMVHWMCAAFITHTHTPTSIMLLWKKKCTNAWCHSLPGGLSDKQIAQSQFNATAHMAGCIILGFRAQNPND